MATPAEQPKSPLGSLTKSTASAGMDEEAPPPGQPGPPPAAAREEQSQQVGDAGVKGRGGDEGGGGGREALEDGGPPAHPARSSASGGAWILQQGWAVRSAAQGRREYTVCGGCGKWDWSDDLWSAGWYCSCGQYLGPTVGGMPDPDGGGGAGEARSAGAASSSSGPPHSVQGAHSAAGADDARGKGYPTAGQADGRKAGALKAICLEKV